MVILNGFQMLTLTYAMHVASGKLPELFRALFSNFQNRDNIDIFLMKSFIKNA